MRRNERRDAFKRVVRFLDSRGVKFSIIDNEDGHYNAIFPGGHTLMGMADEYSKSAPGPTVGTEPESLRRSPSRGRNERSS